MVVVARARPVAWLPNALTMADNQSYVRLCLLGEAGVPRAMH